MLHIHCKEHLAKVRKFAKKVEAADKLQKQLDYLANYACQKDPRKTICDLIQDFAPYSFRFTMRRMRADEGGYDDWFEGGLLYSGPRQLLDGSFPALSVSLDPDDGKTHNWSVHT